MTMPVSTVETTNRRRNWAPNWAVLGQRFPSYPRKYRNSGRSSCHRSFRLRSWGRCLPGGGGWPRAGGSAAGCAAALPRAGRSSTAAPRGSPRATAAERAPRRRAWRGRGAQSEGSGAGRCSRRGACQTGPTPSCVSVRPERRRRAKPTGAASARVDAINSQLVIAGSHKRTTPEGARPVYSLTLSVAKAVETVYVTRPRDIPLPHPNVSECE